jgi:hypothetical protein
MIDIKAGEIEYQLEKPFEFYHGSGNKQCTFLLLREPIFEHYKHLRKLKQMVARAQTELVQSFANNGEKLKSFIEAAKELQEKAEKNPKKTRQDFLEDGKQIIGTIEQSDVVDFAEFMERFGIMICMNATNTLAACNGEVQFTKDHWNKIRPEEQETIAGFWYSFFVMRSAQERNESNSPTDSQQPQAAESDIKRL